MYSKERMDEIKNLAEKIFVRFAGDSGDSSSSIRLDASQAIGAAEIFYECFDSFEKALLDFDENQAKLDEAGKIGPQLLDGMEVL